MLVLCNVKINTLDTLQQFNTLFGKELTDEIYDNAQTMSVPAGGVIIDYGQTIRLIPIVTKGTVKVIREDDEGRELLLYYISANETCAMTFTCCMEHAKSEIKAVAEDDVELLGVPVSLMDSWIVRYPSWKNFVMRTMKARFNELLHTIDHIAFQKLDERLVEYLKAKSAATGSTLLNLSHQDIANDLASSRVVISRLLKKLENEKRLLLYRNQIKLLKEL